MRLLAFLGLALALTSAASRVKALTDDDEVLSGKDIPHIPVSSYGLHLQQSKDVDKTCALPL